MKFNITAKINLLFGLLMLFLGLFLYVYFSRLQRTALTAELDERAKTLLNSLAAGNEYWVLTGNKEQISRLARAALTQKDAVFCEIQDKKGTVLYRGGEKAEGPLIRSYAAPIMGRKAGKRSDEAMLFGLVKEETEEIGGISLAFSLADLDNKLRRERNVIMLIIVLGILAAFLSGSLLTKYILGEPIKTLIAGTARIGRGELSCRLALPNRDELGQLAAAFNHMTENLEMTTVSRDKLAEEVAERKQAEAELLQLLSLHHATLESTADGILVIDMDGLIVTKNRKFLKLWRIPDDIAESKEDEKLLACVLGQLADPEGFMAEVKRLYAHPREKSFDTLDFKDGRVFERLSQPQEIGDRIVGRVWSFRDVTEHRKMAGMLLQAEKLSAVGQLAAGVAHELNNPLGIILGFAQSVVKRIKNEDDPLALPLKTIEREAVRCKDLVQNLLVFARTSKNAQPEELDLNAAAEGALSLILAQTKTRNVELVRELGAGLPRIHAHKTQLQQIIVNLANNAIDAMPKGGTLTISTSISARQPGHVELRVRDTGAGIPKDLQKKIFEPFFTTKEVGKGTGLGLSLVFEMVINHGGTIELESEEGKGAQFTVFLPVHSVTPAPGAS